MKLDAKRGKLLVERCSEENPDALQFGSNEKPEYQPAIVGIATRCGQKSLLVYDRELCIQWLMKHAKMDMENALEWFDFNTAGAWMGKNTPIILERGVE